VRVRDKRESAQFLAEILGLGDPRPFGPFLAVQTGNNVSLDFADDHGPVSPQHYAFLVSESDFDQIFGRIRDRRLPYWADPGKRQPDEVNANDGGRGVYWEDPKPDLRVSACPETDTRTPCRNRTPLSARQTHARADRCASGGSAFLVIWLAELGVPFATGCPDEGVSVLRVPGRSAGSW
jgi:hypothetical protein